MINIKTTIVSRFKVNKVFVIYLISFSVATSIVVSLWLRDLETIVGVFFFIVSTTFLFSYIWSTLYSGRIEYKRAIGLYYFLVFVSILLIMLFTLLYDRTFSRYFDYGTFLYSLASPVFLSGVVSGLVLGDRSYVFIVLNTAIVSFLFSYDMPFLSEAVMLTSIVAGETVLLRKGAQSLFNSIIAGSGALLFFVISLMLIERIDTYIALFAPFSSAITVLFSTYAMLPLIESLFGVVTQIKLLEYANISHPLLKELIDKAPGTYNHSMIVSFLAEAASYEVGADPVLAKVGALFHDIGKLKNPKYFIENSGSVSTHEKLSPAMSRLIIMSHVRDGVELAKKYALPKCIIDIVEQHHGTTLIRYFYEKAKRISKEEVPEEIYRYPGPKPRTKEAAIVMMADSIEAAVRSLNDPTPAKIKEVIRAIVNYLFSDGQFDECPLNLRELKTISDVFLKMLISFYHRRVSYPGVSDGGNGGSSSGSKN
ncbi:MAG: HDIG domain-containing metalloprotein [Thermosulfidibacteraceae bacterium]